MVAPERSSGEVDSVDHAGTVSEEAVHAEGTDTAQLEVLQERLAYKDELVAELTARLEAAAEQLDRLQRSGVRPSSGGGGALPAELVDDQRQLTNELTSAVREWQEMNAAVLLSQIDGRLRELQEQVAGQQLVVRSVPQSETSGEPAASAEGSDEESPGEGQISDAWEAMKARLLEGKEAPAQPEKTDVDTAEDASAAEADTAAREPRENEEVAAPEPLDLDAADREELALAVLARDEYIGYLLQTLADTEQRMEQVVDWEQLANAPEELTRQLREELERISQRGRREELRLSLERARLSREQAKLDQLRAVLERRLRTPVGGKPAEETPKGEPTEADRKARWSRLFGTQKD
ncbi:hypothetical protein [Maioricimonas rarisocia]|nr:hypothetical protein [Maioricimonas rarisocia]